MFSVKTKNSGFTLVEVLVVIGIIAILLAVVLPTNHPRHSTTLIHCLSNQRQITIGFMMWKEDHGGKFSWEVPTTNNGTLEFSDQGYVASSFSVIKDYIREPSVFVCPSDEAKLTATNDASIQNQNISYFVKIDCGTNGTTSILTGDRHLQTNYKPVKPGLFVYSNKLVMNWTRELHGKASTTAGVLSFGDGHGQVVRGTNLNFIFQQEGSISSRLNVP